MKKSLVAALGLILIPVALSGCATMTESPAERSHIIGAVTHYNLLEMNEDIDSFMLDDSPSRLTYWIVR